MADLEDDNYDVKPLPPGFVYHNGHPGQWKTGGGDKDVFVPATEEQLQAAAEAEKKRSEPEPFDYRHLDPEKAFQGNDGASKLLSDISRAQWEDWQVRYKPKVEELITLASDPFADDMAAEQAKGAVQNSFENSRRGLLMQQQGMGVSLDTAEQATQNRKFALAEAASSVDAANTARVGANDRQQKLMAGGLSIANSMTEQ